MTDNMKKLQEEMAKDPTFRSSVLKAKDEKDLVKLATGKGIPLTVDEIKMDTVIKYAVSDDDLEDVAGGLSSDEFWGKKKKEKEPAPMYCPDWIGFPPLDAD